MSIRLENLNQYNQVAKNIRFFLDTNAPYLILYFSENGTLVSEYPKLNLLKIDFRYVIIPYTKIPFTRLTTEIRDSFDKYGLVTYQINAQFPRNKNLIIDLSNYTQAIINKFNPAHFRQRSGFLIKDEIYQLFSLFPNYKKILLYTIDTDKPFNKFIDMKIYPIIKDLRDEIDIPFDHLLFNTIRTGESYYRLLIRNKEYNLQKLMSYIRYVNPSISGELIGDGSAENENIKTSSDVISKYIIDNNLVNQDDKEKVLPITIDYLNKNKDQADEFIRNYEETNKHKDINSQQYNINLKILNNKIKRIAIASILYRVSGNLNKSNLVASKIKEDQLDVSLKKINDKYIDQLLPMEKPYTYTDNIVIKNSNIPNIVGNKYPGHLFKKRNIDFNINLKKDMINALKVLETKDIPLKLKSVKIVDKKPKQGELEISDLSVFEAKLSDQFGNIHNVKIEIPQIQNDGTFLYLGQRKCLINQIILCPISFPKPYMSKFESIYSKFHIYSRRLRTGNYLEIYIGSYKLPIAAVLFYSFGFEETLRLYDIEYKITKNKPEKNDFYTQISQDEYLLFENVDTYLKDEFCRSIIREKLLAYKITKKFGSQPYFNDLIIRMTGRVNSTYLINNAFDNIVDPIVKQVLINQQLPTDLPNIIKYMASKVVSGYRQDRNDLSNQRIRNSEILVHLAQKQILAAYTVYQEQVLSGNKKANLNIVSNKVLKDFMNSEIVADMEYANPIEEMSVMTRVSPVGKSIGGIPDKRAIAMAARNVHPSYYGNIDPLDTPEGPNIGIIQQLTIDAYITSSRGLIHSKKISDEEGAGIISPSVSMIPFVECNDGARVMFSANHAKQMLPLKNPEPPIVQSGYESLLIGVLSQNFIKKSPCNGIIKNVSSDHIIMSCEDGTENKIYITPISLKSGSGINTLSEFKTLVKERQRIRQNDIIAEGSCISNGIISMGRNVLTAVMPYEGYNFEDGVVINEQLITDNAFVSLHLMEEEVLIEENDRLTYFEGEVGKNTYKGEHLVRKTLGEIETLIGFADEESETEELLAGQYIKKSPGGYIVDIEVYSNVDENKFPQLKYLIRRTNERIGRLPRDKFKIRDKVINGVYIKYRLRQERPISLSDKISNRHGNKGIISLIEPNNRMPRTPWGEPIDIIVNPIGIFNRMNIGQLYELYCGFIGKELGKQIISLNDRQKVMSLVENVLITLDSTENQKMARILINNLNKLNKESYSLFIEQIHKQGYFPIIAPPFKGPKHQNIKKALKILKLETGYNLYLPKYNTRTKYKVPVGYSYIAKLEHMGESKLHSRSVGPVLGKIYQPTEGKRREGGQRVGELDSYAIISYGAIITLQEMYSILSDDQKGKNEIINEIIMNGRAKFRPPRSNPTKEVLATYFIGLMLEES